MLIQVFFEAEFMAALFLILYSW